MAPPKKKYSELSKSAKYYRDNKSARSVKKKKDTEINRQPEQRKKRSELTTRNRKADKRGVNRKGKDYDHASRSYVDSSKNRGRTKSRNGSKDGNARGKKK